MPVALTTQARKLLLLWNTMTRLLTTTTVLSVLALAGCRSADYDMADTAYWAGGEFDTADEDTTNDDTGTSSDTSVPAVPTFWSVSGSVTLIDGAIAKNGTGLSLSIIGAESEVICSINPGMLGAPPAAVPDPSLDIWGFWTVWLAPISEDDAECTDRLATPLPTNLQLGIGHLHSLLNPAIDAAGVYDYNTASQSIYGLYIQPPIGDAFPDGSPVYVFGLAGTPANLAGAQQTVVGEQLPNGVYQLETLHPLPLP